MRRNRYGRRLKTDVGNATFTIIPTNNVILLSPNGGEVWVAGTTQPITCLGGGVTTVRLENTAPTTEPLGTHHHQQYQWRCL
ncbi:MAG: hypothetical protein U0176_13090 [Bacteroidia bacterium]